MADDFVCTDHDPIVAIRWWGSYIGERFVRTGQETTGPFHVSFHYSTGAHPWSDPAAQITEYTLYGVQQEFSGLDSQGEPVYRYDAFLPQPFDQWYWSHDMAEQFHFNIGELFMDICKPTQESWGWHAVAKADQNVPINDWAVLGQGHYGPWVNISADMTFELMTPEPATLSLLALGGLALLARRR